VRANQRGMGRTVGPVASDLAGEAADERIRVIEEAG
jgi:hypothetical protein